MINFYDILGISPDADIAEIKAAFRKLAKQYHPDHNPNGKEFFERALQAYETLSDPQRKAAYDYRLKSHERLSASQDEPVRSRTKNWRFDEREMKRRQYYNEHIRKYAKETASYNAQARGRKTYNEYKYILLATPLAVLLFVMIMKLAGPVLPKRQLSHEATGSTLTPGQLQPGDAPYNFLFGNPYYQKTGGQTMVIRNMTGLDAIVCIFTDRSFVRSFYIPAGYSAEVPQLPPRPLDIRYVVGERFSYRARLQEANVLGGFRENASYYMTSASILPASRSEISLVPGVTGGFVKTGEKAFFEPPKND